jgi:hypothetical protein
MPKRHKPASTATARAPRANPVKKTKATTAVGKKPPPRGRADDPLAVVLKEANSDGVTAKELQRRLAVRAAVSPAFIDALRRDFQRHGAGAIAKTRELAPATYVRLSAVLLPMDAEAAEPLPEPVAAAHEAWPEPVAAAEAEAVARRIAELRQFLAQAAEDTPGDGES